MTTTAATFSKNIRQIRASRKIFPSTSYLKRFRYFIENSDWDEMILIYEKRLDKICAGVIIASILYCTPIFIRIFLR
jgi:hypothetical protein